jgi:hypothetical protein
MPPAGRPLTRVDIIVIRISRGLRAYLSCCGVLLRACYQSAWGRTRRESVREEAALSIEFRDIDHGTAGVLVAQAVDWQCSHGITGMCAVEKNALITLPQASALSSLEWS